VEAGEAPGGGARFTLTLPLTLTSMRVVFVRAGGDVLALPATSVLRLLRVGPEQLRSIEGKEMLALDGAPLPLVSLGAVLGTGAAATPATRVPVVLLEGGGRRAAFIVDELLGQQEVVSKPLGRRLASMRWVAGATLLPTGRVALVLRPSALLASAYGEQRSVAAQALARRFAGDVKQAQKRLLLVDDSVTTRTLEKSILEAAGYAVLTASDGSAAWHLLQEHGADLVLSDVEMPSMDGFALAQAIRSSKRFRDLPVVLLTALDSEQDRARGLEAGADAYLVKSAFDQRALLETLKQLL
jgi:two-component system chemotaxis sensor kinase CheA